MYRLLVFSHVLGAILSVGPAMTYGVWLGLARRSGAPEEAFAYRGVLWLDSHVVTPAFVWQLVSGLTLVFAYDAARLTEPWLMASLVLYFAIAGLAIGLIAPRARRAVAALDDEGPAAAAYVTYRRLMRRLSPFVSLGTLAIVYLMVTKPR